MEGTTQGDPAAMVIYAIAIILLILMLVEIRMHGKNHTKTAAYADDLTVEKTQKNVLKPSSTTPK